jgi:hypothetical protein
MAPRSVANPVPASTDNAITPDLAMILHDAKPHPQLGAPAPQPPSTARLGKAAAAIAAGLALQAAAVSGLGDEDADMAGLRPSYLLPPGPPGVLLLAPSTAPRAVAMAAPGIYVVVEVVG